MESLIVRARSKWTYVRIGANLPDELYRLRDASIIITSPVCAMLCPDKSRTVFVPEGEAAKRFSVLGKTYTTLDSMGCSKDIQIIGLGGGSALDVAGYVASTYLRGLPLMFAPTTLLAQADSCIGGKNGINLGRLKNRVGTIYQPDGVVIDVNALTTLPQPIFLDGMAEIIKHAVIADKELFTFLDEESTESGVKTRDSVVLTRIITNSLRVKAQFVEDDEMDAGKSRWALNLGHTFAHTLELISKPGLSHGKAVSVGIASATKISYIMGLLRSQDKDKIIGLLRRYGLPVQTSYKVTDKFLFSLQYDKKATGSQTRLVLPIGIGRMPIRVPIGLDDLRRFLWDPKFVAP